VRVLLVSDDALARAGLATLIAGRGGIEVVGQGSGADASALAAAREPDVVAWDRGPGGEPPAALGRLEAPVLALLWEESQGPEALAAGARGVVLRAAAPERLAAALGAVALGLLVVDASLAELLPRRRPGGPALAEPLTPRESEVLQLLAEGLTNKAIAARLGISEHTAKFHVNAILGKLGAESRTEALVQAARLGLVLL
jgi:DNA-binding NarL/FixJ family response regulator